MRRALLALVLVFGGLGPGALRAAEPGLEQAINLYREGELERAKRAFERLKQSDPAVAARVSLYLGAIAAVKGQSARVDALFEKALRSDPALRLDPQQFKAELIQRFETVRSRLRGTLKVSASLPRATVRVDRKPVGQAPLELQLPPGLHEVEVVREDGGDRFKERAVVPVDGTASIRAELREAAPTASLPTTPTTPVEPPPPPRRARRIWTWVAAGAAVATGAAALGLGLSAKSSYDEYKALDAEYVGQPPPQAARRKEIDERMPELKDTIEKRATGATVCGVVAGVLAATSVVLFFVEGRERRSEARHTALRGVVFQF